MNRPVPFETQQILSEFEMVGYILKQFLTGENVLKRKGITTPSTCSLTNVSLFIHTNIQIISICYV